MRARRIGCMAALGLLVLSTLVSGHPGLGSVDANPAAAPLRLPLERIQAAPQTLLTPEQAAALPPTIQAGIGPGSALQVGVGGTQFICTASFLLRDPVTATYYLATAGHCLVRNEEDPAVYNGHDNPDKVDNRVDVCVAGCLDNALGLGTYVTFAASGDYHPVAFAQSGGVGEDFGLVQLPASAHDLLRPAMPQWGGPTGYDPSATAPYAVHYGHGTYCCPTVGGVASRTPVDQGRIGLFQGVSGDGSFTVLGSSSGGDSGSGVNLAQADPANVARGTFALGTLTHGEYVATPATPLPFFLGTTLAKSFSMIAGAGFALELVAEGDPLPTAPTAQAASITIQSPADGARLAKGSVVTIHGLAGQGERSPPDGSEVQVAIDDPTFAMESRIPVTGLAAWNATWYLSGEPTGAHTIFARLAAGGHSLAEGNRTVSITSSATSGPSPSSSPKPGSGSGSTGPKGAAASGTLAASGKGASGGSTGTASKGTPGFDGVLATTSVVIALAVAARRRAR